MTLRQGETNARHGLGRSQAFAGPRAISALTHRTQRFQQLPAALGEPPYHFDISNVIQLDGVDDSLTFHVVGDTGGVKDADRQFHVAAAMKEDLNLSPEHAPKFFYHLGDVVYFNGEHDQYFEQFYEPYDHYTPPILSIPGNHDGDPLDNDHSSLEGWLAYFMTEKPHVDPESKDAPRVTLSLPNVYWTLTTPLATIVGLYTNVPEHGSVDSIQQQWVTNEFATADKSKPLLVALHHPVYSFDAYHSGSPNMADVLQHAINDSRRIPNLVLTGHVHNYQRINRIIDGDPVPFLVAGNGGYHNLHHLAVKKGTDTKPKHPIHSSHPAAKHRKMKGADAPPAAVLSDDETKAELQFGDDKNWGYMTLTIDKHHIHGSYTAVDKDGHVTKDADTFTTSAAARVLSSGVVSL
jgi:acid phosphatase type 7